jgi:hypothetical protein
VPVVAPIKEYVAYLYAKVVDRDPFANQDAGRGGGRSTNRGSADD